MAKISSTAARSLRAQWTARLTATIGLALGIAIMLGFGVSLLTAAPSQETAANPTATNSDGASTYISFNRRPVRAVRTVTMLVTAYSPDEESCGDSADGITASGYSVFTNGMKLVAADTSLLPFGSMLSIPGYDRSSIVPVLDRGGAIKGNHLDVLFPTHAEAMEWGVQHLEVTIWEYADGSEV